MSNKSKLSANFYHSTLMSKCQHFSRAHNGFHSVRCLEHEVGEFRECFQSNIQSSIGRMKFWQWLEDLKYSNFVYSQLPQLSQNILIENLFEKY